jgi:hypothetical protein
MSKAGRRGGSVLWLLRLILLLLLLIAVLPRNLAQGGLLIHRLNLYGWILCGRILRLWNSGSNH